MVVPLVLSRDTVPQDDAHNAGAGYTTQLLAQYTTELKQCLDS